MKKLSLEKQLLISGGNWKEYIDGGCSAVGVATALELAIPGLNAMAVACLGWGIGRGFNII